MPVGFLTADQEVRYARFAGEPNEEQLSKYFHLDAADRRLINRRHGDHNKLGFAVQLATVRFLGTFLSRADAVPAGVVTYLAQQLDVVASCLARYGNEVRWDHAVEIRDRLGYREFTEPGEVLRLTRWLYARAWGSAQRPSVLFDLATAHLAQRRVLLPGVTTLTRLVARIRERTEARLWMDLSRVVTSEERRRLETLLVIPEGSRQSTLEKLRRPPTKVTSEGLLAALERLSEIRALGVGHHDLSHLPASRVDALARMATSMRAQAIARMAEERRTAVLLAFARVVETRACDDALELFDLLLRKTFARAERVDSKKRLRSLKVFEAAALQLALACRIFVDPEHTSLKETRQAAFDAVSREALLAAAETVEALARQPGDERPYAEILRRYGMLRRVLPRLSETIAFDCTKVGRPVLDAWNALRGFEGRKSLAVSEVAMPVVSPAWRRYVSAERGLVDRRAYTLAVVDRFWQGLQRREIFVATGTHFGDPRTQLLDGVAWKVARPKVSRMLELPLSPKPFLQVLRDELEHSYEQTANRLGTNPSVRVEKNGKRETLVLSPLDALEEPPSLVEVRGQVAALLPLVDLPDLLLEVDAMTGFTQEFSHVSESGARVEDLSTSLCATLLAEACNIGIEPVVRQDTPALTRGRLGWVGQNYIRGETLRRANARLVDYQSKIPLARQWGGGEVASADGLRFVVPVRTINAGPNPKYFGVGRGITYYNFTSDQFTGFHSIVIPGTLRDSTFILEGLLEQETALRPSQVMSDTAGYSDLVFGLFRLLGYQFSPRIADLGDSRLWRIDAAANYGPLNRIARNRLDLGLITPLWEDILRAVGSLMLGTVSASELIRVLHAGGRPTGLGRAIAELGRAPKTVHLLKYVDDPVYRRGILVQLNRQEGRHSLARAVFHGQRGELRQRYREGQEDQLDALGLVVNAIALWNTRYVDAALDHLRERGGDVLAADVRRLSPMGFAHINLFGRYYFGLSEAVRRGGLRPLREPEHPALTA